MFGEERFLRRVWLNEKEREGEKEGDREEEW